MTEQNYTKTGIVVHDDIVTRLRAFVSSEHFNPGDRDRIEAADEIERLRATVAWFVADRDSDFVDKGDYYYNEKVGVAMTYDGVGYLYDAKGDIPDYVKQAFREARRG